MTLVWSNCAATFRGLLTCRRCAFGLAPRRTVAGTAEGDLTAAAALAGALLDLAGASWTPGEDFPAAAGVATLDGDGPDFVASGAAGPLAEPAAPDLAPGVSALAAVPDLAG